LSFAKADSEDVSDVQAGPHSTNYDSEGAKTFPSIHISGSARVHVGDAYFDYLIINQFCQMRMANEAIVHQIGSLRSLSGNSKHDLAGYVQQRVSHVNDILQFQNATLQQLLGQASRSTVSTKLVSQTKLNFTLVPLGFSFEHNV
jgi:hypothetical protein